MASTLNEIATVIASHLKREQDEPFKRVVAKHVDWWRSRLIVNSLEKHPEQRKFYRQTLWMPMVLEEQIPCPTNVRLPQVSISKFRIPAPMRLADMLFDYAGSIDGLRPFREAPPGQWEVLSAGQYSRLTTFYEFTNFHTRVRSPKELPMMRLDGVYDDPREVLELNCKTNGLCNYWDFPYPATGDMIQLIVQGILEGDYKDLVVPTATDIEVDSEKPKNGEPKLPYGGYNMPQQRY